MDQISLCRNSCSLQPAIVIGSDCEPLLSSSLPNTSIWDRLGRARVLPLHQMCLQSKAALLILILTALVSASFTLIMKGTGIAALLVSDRLHIQFGDTIWLNERAFFLYLGFAVVFLFYPLAGFLADVHIGRYRTVIASVAILLIGFISTSLDSILYLVKFFTHQLVLIDKTHATVFSVFGVIGFVLSVCGLAGYQANITQLGLDQLFEFPNEYSGLFVHWMEWITEVGAALVGILYTWYTCEYQSQAKTVIISLPLVISFCLVILLFIAYCKRHWFCNRGKVKCNSYKVIFKVLNFARKHKHPLRRSAFTYTDDEVPSRIDFAKERYGGPFTTEQVEDVKTFLRILTIFLALGPVFVIKIPSVAVFSTFAQHFTANNEEIYFHNCTLTWAIFDTGTLKVFIVVLIFPIYIWIVYSLLRNCIPRTFIRLWIGIFIFLLGAGSMLLIDVIGHVSDYYRHHEGLACMFLSTIQISSTMGLGMHWAVLFLPNILLGIAPSLIMSSTLEFISAQSPHSMKGFLVGLFFATRGLFQFISSIILFPFFSLDVIWRHQQSVINCDSGYLIFVFLVGLLSLISFTVVAKHYKYRERDDPPYNRMHVERVFAGSCSES